MSFWCDRFRFLRFFVDKNEIKKKYGKVIYLACFQKVVFPKLGHGLVISFDTSGPDIVCFFLGGSLISI